MILQVPAAAPWYLHAGAALLLTAHIGGGSLGMASGTVSMIARKGGRLHRQAGNVFFAAMLSMSLVGATVAPFLPEAQWTNTMAGVFTFYLVTSAWLTAKRRDAEVGHGEAALVLVPIALATVALTLALARSPTGEHSIIGVFAGLSLFAAALDVRAILSGGLSGPSRTSRHIWRISLALFVAMGSFFLGQPKFVPQILKDTGLNFVPPLATLALLVFWMIRVRLPRRRRKAAAPQPVAA
jgi:hypothetical protein